MDFYTTDDYEKNYDYSYNRKRRRSRSPSEDRYRRRRKNKKKRKLEDIEDIEENTKTLDNANQNTTPEDDISTKVFADENHIYFRCGVNQKSINKLIEIINNKNNEYKELTKDNLLLSCEPAPLYLHITSFGGGVLSAFRAIDCIKSSKLPIYTIVDGYAASAGSMIAVVGKKKYMTPSSYVLIHELSTWFGGKYSELKDDMKNAKRMMDDIEKLYLDNTKISRRKFKECRKHDLWWNQKKCLDLGIVEELWEG